MVSGGDIDRNALLESFSRIREDITRLNAEINLLKLKKPSSENNTLTKEQIAEIVRETLSQVKKNSLSDSIVRKINKKRKSITLNRIIVLAEQKNLSVPQIKDAIVEEEGLCSKATFYRYIERLKEKGIISFVKIDDQEVVIKI
jgi:hypothetical protein